MCASHKVRSALELALDRMTQELVPLADAVAEAVESEVPGLAVPPLRALFYGSARQNIDLVLEMFRNDVEPSELAVPRSTLEHVRRLAQRDGPATDLVAGFAVGNRRLIREAIRILDELELSGHELAEAVLVLLDRFGAYADRAALEVVAAHARAREEWVQDRAFVLAARVRAILQQQHAVEEAELPGYRLDQHHLAIVAGAGQLNVDGNPIGALRAALVAAGEALGCETRPLFVPLDAATAWAWFPLGARPGIEAPAVAAALTRERVIAAAGAPGAGIHGFRRSHREALAARDVALTSAAPVAPIVWYDEVAPIAGFCADLESARTWVAGVLGDLALDDERHAVVRDTVRAFLSCEGSYAKTAAVLNLHRNSVQYRIQRAEELRGRSLREDRLDLEIALLACYWLGSAVLTPPKFERTNGVTGSR